ncbi:type IV conjugative transfer system coupling protein TraD [Rosenbergiella collisarenosi]|uniref:type IV conjugative transfer system coupling protein TraD n=1 Tax=Rosenbergiella collisarenosi TaxID=1544695 RepID=UPI001F4E3DB6|nr:type IV conjugative transfer system coupling protein TraD [Rosenbergiella collisarenosi]
MSLLTPSNITKGGQITAYRFKMFNQVNSWFSFWIILIFVALSIAGFYKFTSQEILENGITYEIADNFSSLDLILGRNEAKTFSAKIYENNELKKTIPLSLKEVINSDYMKGMGDKFMLRLQLFIGIGAGISTVIYFILMMVIGAIGKKETDDEYISGMTLTDDPKKVNKMLKKNNVLSDLKIGDLHLVKNSEIQNMLLNGTVGTGKSTIIRYILDYIVARGDRFIIFDSGGTFVETHYDSNKDFILNAHDERCANWDLWEECQDVVDFENFSTALIPIEGNSDPFWVSSSRTILGDAAMQMSNKANPTIEEFLKVILSLSLKNLRQFLKDTPSANLVEEKIEKTAISIRSVTTNYAKSLRFLQGIDKGQDKFSIRQWMSEEKYSNSGLFISTTSDKINSTRPLITMWLSMATTYLQSMGENRDRRVWFIIDELPTLQKIPGLLGTIAEARKFGGCFVLGLQNQSQLTNTYGRDMAKAILDLLNTRLYGRAPSSEQAKEVEKELGNQRRWEAKEQNSFGLDQVRDGISIGRDRVHQAVVDYEEVMSLPDLTFYTRLPGNYPVIKLKVPYRALPKRNAPVEGRKFKDALSPIVERLIVQNERGFVLDNISDQQEELTDIYNSSANAKKGDKEEKEKTTYKSVFFDDKSVDKNSNQSIQTNSAESASADKKVEREVKIKSENVTVNDSDTIAKDEALKILAAIRKKRAASSSANSNHDVNEEQEIKDISHMVECEPPENYNDVSVEYKVKETPPKKFSENQDSSNSESGSNNKKSSANGGFKRTLKDVVNTSNTNQSGSDSEDIAMSVTIAQVDEKLIISEGPSNESYNGIVNAMAAEEININRHRQEHSLDDGEPEL